DKLYNYTPDGYCGDEDNGQTSAWYVFSSLGFYPVTPGSGQYVIGSPLFKKATLKLENGKKLEIKAPENSMENVYVKSLTFNGKKITNNFFTHKELLKGGTIIFQMSPEPAKNRGTREESFPFSMSTEK
ncbi:MAG TPA: glycoside hydrolase domain-containing protein, partial [Bacteroidales bacterium]|nr:glycoside hydrolase domain-containing protein [Bacteroidales bacterium]